MSGYGVFGRGSGSKAWAGKSRVAARYKSCGRQRSRRATDVHGKRTDTSTCALDDAGKFSEDRAADLAHRSEVATGYEPFAEAKRKSNGRR